MADEFSLQAIISADSSQFTDAMSALAGAAQQASEALRSQLAGSSEQASEAVENLHAKSAEASEGIKESFNSIRETATHLLETFAVFEGIDILKEQVKQSLEFGESMQKLSVETGATTNFLQTLKFAADATGTSFEGVESAARRLTQVYSTLRSGSGSPQLLGALSSAHINVSQLANIQTGFEAISHAVQEFGVQSEIARNLVVQLLGRQGLDFLPILNQFDELKQKAADLHIVLPPEMLESLDKGNEALNILGAVIKADAERFLSSLAPSIAETANKLADMAAEASKSGELDRWAKTIQEDMQNLPAAVSHVAEVFGVLAKGAEDTAWALEKIWEIDQKIERWGGNFQAALMGITPPAPPPPAPISAHQNGAAAPTLGYLEGPQSPATPQPPPPPPNHSDLTQQAGAAAKQAQEQALQAFQQQLQAYTEEQAIEVSVATNTAQAKVQAATNVYEKAVSLIGQTGAVSAAGYQKEVDAALRAGVEELNARREMLNQTKALAAEQINAAAAEQLQQLAVAKAALAEELAAHQITKAQELAAEQNLASQTLAIELGKDSQLESLWAGDAQKFQEFEQQKVDAAQKAQQQIIELQTQSLQQQEQQTQEAGTKMAADINQGLTLMTKYFETAGKQQQNVMREAFQEIVKDFQAKLAQMVAQWLESTSVFKLFTGGEALGQGPHGTAGPGGGIIGGIGSVLSGTVGGPNGAGYSLMGGAIGGNPGLAGLGPSSFAPGQDIPPGAFNQSLIQAFEGATGTIGNVFEKGFAGAGSTITSLFSSGFQGASSVLSSIFGSLFGGAGGGGGGLGGIMSIFSSLSSFLPMLGFEQGGIVPSAAGGMVVPGGSGGTFAMLHPREMVLPAKYSEGVQRMIDRGNGDGGPTNHIEIHSNGHNYSALDSDGMSEILDKHAGAISDAVMNHLGNHGGREKYR